jgi:hypothetical protein
MIRSYPPWRDGIRAESDPEQHCPEFPDCREERYVRDDLASIKAGEPVGRWKPQRCAACEALTTAHPGRS